MRKGRRGNFKGISRLCSRCGRLPLGTGFQGKVREQTQKEIAKINVYKQMGAYVISADIPSGLNGDNGVKETCVLASETVAIGEYKFGHLLNDGIDACGNLIKAD
ncbi:MAG: hypothetical protein IJY38_01900, partial [Clostridia bacterium]|nr:hypothetical protein [Clostridia bacterium]